MSVCRIFLQQLCLSIITIIPAFASDVIEEIQREQALGKTIANITILGLERTQTHVVQRELLIRQGEPLELSEIEESLQRIKNLRLFHDVSDAYYVDNNNQVYIQLSVAESFTTIPIFKIAEGGGTRYLVVGAYDINTLGSYLETGAQYESWNNEDGGVVWFRQPRFMEQWVRLGADLWSVKRPRNLYEPDGVSQGDFVLYQRKLNLFVDKEWSSEFTLGFGAELNQTQLLDGSMSGQLSAGVAQAVANSSIVDTNWAKFYLKLGRLNYDNVRLEGKSFEFTFDYTSADLGSDYQAYRTSWDNKVFWRVTKRANVGWRLKWVKTNSQELQDLFYVGGFEHVRGYFDGQLRGRQYWQSNLEYRQLLLTSSWYYLQGNIFADVAQLISPTTTIESNNDDVFYSTGIGLRLGSPKIYRFIARLDIALNTSHPATSRVSFAVQQFF